MPSRGNWSQLQVYISGKPGLVKPLLTHAYGLELMSSCSKMLTFPCKATRCGDGTQGRSEPHCKFFSTILYLLLLTGSDWDEASRGCASTGSALRVRATLNLATWRPHLPHFPPGPAFQTPHSAAPQFSVTWFGMGYRYFFKSPQLILICSQDGKTLL